MNWGKVMFDYVVMYLMAVRESKASHFNMNMYGEERYRGRVHVRCMSCVFNFN